MKIDYSFGSLKTGGGVEAKGIARTPVNKAQDSSAQNASSELQLSPLMSHVKKTEAEMNKTPSFDQKKVDELREAIAAGKFKINPEAIAERLLKTVGELVGQPG